MLPFVFVEPAGTPELTEGLDWSSSSDGTKVLNIATDTLNELRRQLLGFFIVSTDKDRGLRSAKVRVDQCKGFQHS